MFVCIKCKCITVPSYYYTTLIININLNISSMDAFYAVKLQQAHLYPDQAPYTDIRLLILCSKSKSYQAMFTAMITALQVRTEVRLAQRGTGTIQCGTYLILRNGRRIKRQLSFGGEPCSCWSLATSATSSSHQLWKVNTVERTFWFR